MSRKAHVNVRLVLFASASLALSASLVGCATAPVPAPASESLAGELSDAPDWVRKNCYAHWGDDEKAKKQVCGVGTAAGSRNPSLMRTAAIGRGRTEIARSLQVKLTALLKDYQRNVTGGETFGISADDEQVVQDTSKQYTEMTLNGTEMIESWISPNNTMYVLMSLSAEKFKDALLKSQQLNEVTRDYIVKNADKAFAELDAAGATPPAPEKAE